MAAVILARERDYLPLKQSFSPGIGNISLSSSHSHQTEGISASQAVILTRQREYQHLKQSFSPASPTVILTRQRTVSLSLVVCISDKWANRDNSFRGSATKF